ncbi:hypothetical protein F183_A16960 [Bryobacterales bacterium F-183]|nr:hypothetical protein F183_A16960 [Bryobacterales bacterium F-183]
MTYLIVKIFVSVSLAGIIGFAIGWWWTRQAERRRSMELEGVWTQKIQRANRELDALRLDLRTEANRSIAASDAEEQARDMRDQLRRLQDKAESLEAELNATRQKLRTAERDVERLAPIEKSATKDREEAQQVRQNLSKLESQLATAQEKVRIAEQQIERLTAGSRTSDAKQQSLLKEKDAALARLLAQVEDLQSEKRRADTAQAELDKLRAMIEQMPGMTLVEPPPLIAPDPAAGPDDLKTIKGIGPVLEKKLNSMGVSQYRQIARWTEAHINYYQAMLPEFKNRIARDRWVESAAARHFEKYGERI